MERLREGGEVRNGGERIEGRKIKVGKEADQRGRGGERNEENKMLEGREGE